MEGVVSTLAASYRTGLIVRLSLPPASQVPLTLPSCLPPPCLFPRLTSLFPVLPQWGGCPSWMPPPPSPDLPRLHLLDSNYFSASLPTSRELPRNWEVPFISTARVATKTSVNVGSWWGFHLCPFSIRPVSIVRDSPSPCRVRGPPPLPEPMEPGVCALWLPEGGWGSWQGKGGPPLTVLCVSWPYCHVVFLMQS